MPDTAEIAALKAAKEKAELERDTAKAQADKAVSKFNTNAEPTKALLAVVPSSGLTGQVTSESGVGVLEASLLAASAISDAAVIIRRRLPQLPEGCRYIILTTAPSSGFADWNLFQASSVQIVHLYDVARRLHEEADAAANAGQHQPHVILEAIEMAGAAAAGAGLELLSRIASYLHSDYAVSPTAIAGADLDLLATTLAGLLPRAWLPDRWPVPVSESLIGKLLGTVVTARDGGSGKRAAAEAAAKKLTDTGAKGDAGQKAVSEALALRYAAAIKAYEDADRAYSELVGGLGADRNGRPLVSRIIEQKTIIEEIDKGGAAVLLQLGGTAGTVYTKKNLWSFFGGIPLFVSGGAVASFLVFGSDGILVGGQYPIHSGFLRMNEVCGALARAVRRSNAWPLGPP